MKFKTIIIEDEEPARNIVKLYLANFDTIDLIGEYADGYSGVKAINELKPDLIFLDIQMPKLTGFELLELIEHRPEIIFTTAYDQYAIKAFEANATDYLLKPFSRERFELALNKVFEKLEKRETNDSKINSIISTINEKPDIISRVAVKSGSRIDVIPVDDIIYFAAEGDYVMIYTHKDSFLKEKTMKYFETHLDSQLFVRIHRSSIININEISRIEHYDKESYLVVLKNNVKLKVSDSGYKSLKQMLKL